MVGVGIARWGWMHALVGLLAVIVPGSVAVAQVVDTSPGHVVVMREKADLRCGETYYKVMEVKAGTLLVIDGSSAEWARVSYPPAGTAFVQAEHVRYDASASTATVTEPTRLRAANFTTGFRGSWKSLLATPLPLGTVLKVTEPAADEDGRVLAYRVVVPAAARGFMRREDLRQATAEEVAAARRSSDGVVEAPRPGRTDPAPAPVPVPVPSPAEDSTAVPVDRSTDSARPTLLDPMTPPGQEPPADVAGASPGTLDSPTPMGDADPTATDPAPPRAEPSPRPTTLRDLERAFEAIRRESPDDAEYQELIGEFERLRESMPPGQERLRRQIQGRIDWLSMKIEIRERQRELDEMKRQATSQGREVATKLADLERQRQYAIVGRLLPSTVYDGRNLPLLYRLQSVSGGTGPRTIGYLRPSAELELPSKLNQVVGVIGEVAIDPGMSINLINARRIDVLQSTDGGPVRNP